MSLSPMMKQYMEIKAQHPDEILFFRLGDFYEMFFDDAHTVAKELDLVLTGKNCGLEERAPMCGVPYHSVDGYIEKLVGNGYNVAICEQIEDPATAKGIVKREITKIVTPGTLTSQNIESEKSNNYLACIFKSDQNIGLAYADISTGEVKVTSFAAENLIEAVNELVRIDACELIMNDEGRDSLTHLEAMHTLDVYKNTPKDFAFDLDSATKKITRQYGIHSISPLGLKDAETIALGALLSYLEETQMQTLSHMMKPDIYKLGSHMALDSATIRNLEITKTLFEKKVKGSLLGILDKTHTAMGARMMKQWLREPLNEERLIVDRHDAVDELFKSMILRNNIRENLKPIYDFERLAGKMSSNTANARDMIALASSITSLADIKYDIEDAGSPLLVSIAGDIDTLDDIHEKIDMAINDDPPFSIREGNIIKHGFSAELDEITDSIKDAKQWIAELEGVERKRTGIPNLKVGFNKVFGYYLEITRSYYDRIPEEYIRKQTLTNAERFITPQLKEMESIVSGAEAKINDLEYRLFTELREYIKSQIPRIQTTSKAIATLDVLASFAEVSSKMDYVRPTIDTGDVIDIKKGRHPVIEQNITDGIFVANDTYIDRNDYALLLITGPNMSGKSTYMRQTAIIVLMAQAGCFVPADSAQIGICDRIFTRIGASDNLAAGESTFFVEMSELAYILNNATERSLVILDEIGRGTSTYDGLAIAWAACEYLLSASGKIRTLFASHYHELTALEDQLKGFHNLNIAVSEDGDDIVFLHRIDEGSASRSYGLHVAKIAGIPEELITRANEKLDELED